MTRRRSVTKVAQQRPTRAVGRCRPTDRVATLRLTVKLVLWAAFFTVLFTLHAHVGLRTSLLRSETSRLQARVTELLNERRQIASELGGMVDSGRIREMAEVQLGMVRVAPCERLMIRPQTVSEVEEANALWRVIRGADHPSGGAIAGEWIESLAGLLADQETTG